MFYSRFLSGAQRLPNGNTLIASGSEGAIFEVTPGGRTVWGGSLGFPPRPLYRATRYAPDHPGLAGLDLRPKGAAELPEPVRWHADGADPEPAARGPFAVYLEGRALTYAREDCAAADTEAPFFVHA